MMTNLFSVFDPATSTFKLSWMFLWIPFFMLGKQVWKKKSLAYIVMSKISNSMKKEVSYTLGKPKKSTEMMTINLMILLIFLDLLALFPQIFSVTSQVSFNLPLSASMWILLTFFGFINKTKNMIAHMLPKGTPGSLMMFMVLIELTSSLIRPITLCVRLTANMIAGHILLSLVSIIVVGLPVYTAIPMSVVPIILSILEMAVSCIQAYVFMTLITLYTSELK